MLPFAIVQFVDGGGLAVIPSRCFTGPEEAACFWPPGRTNISKSWRDMPLRLTGQNTNYVSWEKQVMCP